VPSGVYWFNLPHPYYSRLNFKRGATQYHISLYAKIRANYMLSKVRGINPDIFITEFFPFGREDARFELFPVLLHLKKKRIKIYASIGYPYIVRGNMNILIHHCDLYDRFFIHTPKALEFSYLLKDIDNPLLKYMYSRTFEHIKDKVEYTGYILPFDLSELEDIRKIRQDLRANGKIVILVSRGGGVRYPKIITNSILAKSYLSDKYIFVIATGPASSGKEMSLFRSLIKKGKHKQIYLYKYLSNFTSYLRASDISINMAGYNTSVQLLYFKKPSIVIPSSEDPETAIGYCSEQISRGRILKDYLGARTLDYHKFTAGNIVSNIKSLKPAELRPSLKSIKNDWFNGAEITAGGILNG
jgi:predicted glycosyltransferase